MVRFPGRPLPGTISRLHVRDETALTVPTAAASVYDAVNEAGGDVFGIGAIDVVGGIMNVAGRGPSIERPLLAFLDDSPDSIRGRTYVQALITT